MKRIKNLVLGILLLTIFSCSDGAQMGQKIHQLIQEKKIVAIVIQTESKTGQLEKKEITIGKKTFENQFIVFEKEYINMGRIKTLKVDGNKLLVNM